ncbi:MAG: hypothetical protein ABIG61_04915 [Planctomycetota bacterium]
MRYCRNHGIVLMIVVALIALGGLAVFILSSLSRQIAFETVTVQLGARSRNLFCSARAWVEKRALQGSLPDKGQAAELEADGGSIRIIRMDKGQVRIETLCVQGGRRLSRQKILEI